MSSRANPSTWLRTSAARPGICCTDRNLLPAGSNGPGSGTQEYDFRWNIIAAGRNGPDSRWNILGSDAQRVAARSHRLHSGCPTLPGSCPEPSGSSQGLHSDAQGCAAGSKGINSTWNIVYAGWNGVDSGGNGCYSQAGILDVLFLQPTGC